MRRLYIFNPETDYALASDSEFYTPPARVIELRRRDALLPALFASSDSNGVLLLLDPYSSKIMNTKGGNAVIEKRLRIKSLDDAVKSAEEFKDYVPTPWGWNRQIRKLLHDSFGDMPGLPDNKKITILRNISHRRTTIEFIKRCSDWIDNEIELPIEVTDAEAAVRAFKNNRNLFFKAPWSSSGRGILFTGDLEERHVEPWIRGIISRQGSVMMEKGYNRKLDFATEWFCDKGSALFLGFSIFNVSRRGKYHNNIIESQDILKKIISDACHRSVTDIVKHQQEIITSLIASVYDGPVGIDMLVTEAGAVNPCVEINLRHTMGMVGLLKY